MKLENVKYIRFRVTGVLTNDAQVFGFHGDEHTPVSEGSLCEIIMNALNHPHLEYTISDRSDNPCVFDRDVPVGMIMKTAEVLKHKNLYTPEVLSNHELIINQEVYSFVELDETSVDYNNIVGALSVFEGYNTHVLGVSVSGDKKYVNTELVDLAVKRGVISPAVGEEILSGVKCDEDIMVASCSDLLTMVNSHLHRHDTPFMCSTARGFRPYQDNSLNNALNNMHSPMGVAFDANTYDLVSSTHKMSESKIEICRVFTATNFLSSLLSMSVNGLGYRQLHNTLFPNGSNMSFNKDDELLGILTSDFDLPKWATLDAVPLSYITTKEKILRFIKIYSSQSVMVTGNPVTDLCNVDTVEDSEIDRVLSGCETTFGNNSILNDGIEMLKELHGVYCEAETVANAAISDIKTKVLTNIKSSNTAKDMVSNEYNGIPNRYGSMKNELQNCIERHSLLIHTIHTSIRVLKDYKEKGTDDVKN